jgi:hypothetical protein
MFTRHADGRVTVDSWPDEFLIADDFLAEVDPELAVVGDGIVSFHGVEPPATYGLSRRDWLRNGYHARKSPEPGNSDG